MFFRQLGDVIIRLLLKCVTQFDNWLHCRMSRMKICAEQACLLWQHQKPNLIYRTTIWKLKRFSVPMGIKLVAMLKEELVQFELRFRNHFVSKHSNAAESLFEGL